MAKNLPRTIIVILVMLLTGCLSLSSEQPDEQSHDELAGQILLWHTWEGEERETLNDILKGFSELHPRVTIVEESYPLSEIEARFREHAKIGLGPDILVGPANWANRLAGQGLIQDVSGLEPDRDIYLKATIEMLSEGDKMYGLPLSLNTFALYYNKALLAAESGNSGSPPTIGASGDNPSELIQSQADITSTQTITPVESLVSEFEPDQPEAEAIVPPTDLDELLRQANEGQSAAIRTDFYGGFWGVQAFGGQLFDEEGRVVLDQGGFTNWLGWLKLSQDTPHIILNRNPDELLLLFTTGKVTYYVGSTQELPALQEALGEELVGAVRLPSRHNNPAGPFLQAEALMFNNASTDKSTELALRLAQYLTNAEQQRKLALSVGKLPTNNRVNIDPRVSPIVAEFIAQSKTAVPISLQDINKFDDLVEYGNDLYARFLEGEISVGEATSIVTEKVNEKYGLEIPSDAPADCDATGHIILWNTWSDEADQEALRQIQENFMRMCPEVSIEVTNIDPVEFQDRYEEAIENERAPHLFIGTNQQIKDLVAQEQVLNVNNLLDVEFTQRFIPLVGQSVLCKDNAYGIPVAVNTMALYYNPSLVEDPPMVLNDLLVAAAPERQVAIPIGFKESYWGIAAFGESGQVPLFDEEGRLIIEEAGLREWLTWLKEAQTQPGIVLSTDRAALQTLFKEEQAAFLVDDASQLKTFQTTLGSDKVSVVSLPSGSPLLNVDIAFITPYTSPEERAAAVKFAQFMTNVGSQKILLEQAGRVPTNINLNTTTHPKINSFVEQVNGGMAIPNIAEVEPIFEWGDVVYEQVLENEIEPEVAARDFTDLVDTINGFEVAETVVAEECLEEGQVSLWHSWNEVEQLAWQVVIDDFVEMCPSIQISSTYVSPANFTRQLRATLEADSKVSPPDFFITPHFHLEEYQEDGLIRDITSLVDKEWLVDHHPKSVTALSRGEELFGLPHSFHLPALYYHTDSVKEPAKTFENLLAQARQGKTVAMKKDFYNLFWGAAAFGCQPCQSGEIFDEQDKVFLTEEDLADWKAWLTEADELDAVFFSSNQTVLESLFLQGQVDYLIADPSFINKAQETLGIANVGVAPLPQGEEEQLSRPFLQVDGFFFYKETTEEQIGLALKFAKFAISGSNQTLLMQTANFVPANNLAVATADDATVAAFIAEIESGILWPNDTKQARISVSNVYHLFDDLAVE